VLQEGEVLIELVLLVVVVLGFDIILQQLGLLGEGLREALG
jgi:hypothetical protein